ncbi:MAG: ATP-binding protein [Clostridiales bacterium]|nr:ATP-binding protein [Clostridiales bacterium]
MTAEFWGKISYTVQLLAACLVFMLPARKRPHFPAIAAGGAGMCLALSYAVNSFYAPSSVSAGMMIYWLAYIVVSMVYIFCCLDITMTQAVYCAAYCGGVQHIAYDLYMILFLLGRGNPLLYFLIYAAVYVLCYFLCAKKLPEQGVFSVTIQSLFPIVTIIALVWLLSVCETTVIATTEAGLWHRLFYRIIDALCCYYILWVQISQKERLSLQRELDGIYSMWLTQKRQYKLTRDTIDSINRKCHDLKHQIRALRLTENEQDRKDYLDELEKDIMIYDAAVETGNKALDTVLMEKELFCKSHQIQWSCMAEASRLAFMKPEDIYAIFGNAIDNAITAVGELHDAEKKVINVKVFPRNDMIVMQFRNYFDGELRFENGLPLTTKSNKRDHGFGVKSIRYTAEKYNGTITVQAEDGVFTLQALIPAA